MEQNDSALKQCEECLNCAEGDNRCVYTCDNCGYESCWDEVFDHGCFEVELESGEVVCPECGKREITKTGQVGAGIREGW